MAGRNLFANDPIPQSTPNGQTTGTTVGRNLFAQTPEEMRAERLRKIARASIDQMQGAPDASETFGHAFTLGLQKPVSGLAEAVGGEVRDLFGGDDPASFGERYQAGVGAYQDRLDEARRGTRLQRRQRRRLTARRRPGARRRAGRHCPHDGRRSRDRRCRGRGQQRGERRRRCWRRCD